MPTLTFLSSSTRIGLGKTLAHLLPIVQSLTHLIFTHPLGSGKTLAYLLPIVQTLNSFEARVTRQDGIMAVVLSPTRELAVQIMDVLQNVLRAHTHIVPGCVIGGEKKKSEKVLCVHGIAWRSIFV